MKTGQGTPRFHRRVLATALGFGVAVLDQAKTSLESSLNRVQPATAAGGENQSGPLRGSSVDCLQAIIDGLGDEVMIVTPGRRIKQVNAAVVRRLGAMPIIGEACFRISHGSSDPCTAPWRECPLKQVLETGQTVRVLHTGGEPGQSGERWAEVVTAPVWDGEGRITDVIELTRDITESRRLQQELFKANRELLALNFIGRTLSQTLDLQPALQAVAGTMLDALEARVSWIKLSGAEARPPLVTSSREGQAETVAGLAAALAEGRELPASWHGAMTALKSKGIRVGMAGVATTGSPFGQEQIQLLDAIGNQITVAVERCRLYEEVQLAGDLRRELLHSLITTQEEERRRIARELHDEFGQSLTALRLCLERLALSPASGGGTVGAQLTQPLSLCQQAEDEVDKLIFDLRPALIDDLGVVEAIRSQAEARLGAAGIKVGFRVSGEAARLPGEREVALFRVMQEAMNNIIKHAGAANVAIHLQFRKNEVIAGIQDDGCGFEARKPTGERSNRHGLGLLGMKERIGLVGGSLSIISKPGAGTRVKVVIPLAEERVGV